VTCMHSCLNSGCRVNLDQQPGVQILLGPGLTQAKPGGLVDMDHNQAHWRDAPHSTKVGGCDEPSWVVIDLGNWYITSAVRICEWFLPLMQLSVVQFRHSTFSNPPR
jgi:hypothetical protein